MDSFTISVIFMFSSIMAASTVSAQTAQEYLDPHNAARAEVRVPPLTWDPVLASTAMGELIIQRQSCAFSIKIAKNQVISPEALSATDVVGMWVNQSSNYIYASNSCTRRDNCNAYTQVVWGNSVSLGCAQSQCLNGWWLYICMYSPPGNILGQRPYIRQAGTNSGVGVYEPSSLVKYLFLSVLYILF